MDLIDRKELLELYPVELETEIKNANVPYAVVRQNIIDQKPVDAEPVVHGHWDADADGYADGELVYDHWFCSQCEWDDNGCLEEKPSYKYCPNCGAKMDGEHKLSRPKNKTKREVKNGT